MKIKVALLLISLAYVVVMTAPIASAGNDDFSSVVKLIEQFYHVKHQSIPLLARAGMQTARTAAKIKGGDYKRLVEAGSARVAFFEDQDFDSQGRMASFKSTIQVALNQNWSPVIQTLAPKTEEQTYIYLRDAGKTFAVLVITIERREATVVQANVNPEVLAQLMKNPNDMAQALTNDATINEP